MSTRSDVGLAIKTEAFEALPASVKAFLAETDFFDTKLEHEEGRLFHVQCIKWDDFAPPISDLYAALKELDGEDFIIIEACHDYPDSENGDRGDWVDNPWGLEQVTTTSVEFYVDDEGCPNCDGTGRETCPLCEGTNRPSNVR